MIANVFPQISGIVKIEMDEPRQTGGILHEPMNWVREIRITHRDSYVNPAMTRVDAQKLYGPTRESLLLPCEIAMDAALRRVAADAVVPGACE